MANTILGNVYLKIFLSIKLSEDLDRSLEVGVTVRN